MFLLLSQCHPWVGSVHAGPVSVWLPLAGDRVAAALPLGWSCPTEQVQGGLSQTDRDRWVWVPQSLSCTSGHVWWLPVLHRGEVTVSPW